MPAIDALSRDHPDPYAAGLPPLEVDRQRVVHCAAFRRLQHKTQVFVAPDSDHFRTRLTHTLEVAHLSRAIAARLELDSDLCEVVALAHDLGHPPFGHAGEQALSACLREHGGFEHNQHALRVVELLEHPYPEFRGLNLTRITRECIAKHETRFDRPGPHPLQDGRPAPPESRAVDLADRVAYALHDLQDGLYAGLLTLDDLRSVRLWRDAYDGPCSAGDEWRGRLRPAIDRMLRRIVDDIVAAGTAAAVRRRETPDLRERPSTGPALSAEMAALIDELDACLVSRVYRSELLQAADAQAREVLSALFAALVARPEHLPPRFRRRVDEFGLVRVVTDYVAGMTDRYCMDEHARVLG
ncbi:MAG: dNTP triphosphohydrolase [Phycisphaerales bacterium]|nr:dNTP triphosphohydrolase [Phycisphaerales bacterium]